MGLENISEREVAAKKYFFLAGGFYLSSFLYVLTPEGDIRRVPGNRVLGVSLFLLLQTCLHWKLRMSSQDCC